MLRAIALIARCQDGSAFVLAGAGLHPGATLRLDSRTTWRIPSSASTVPASLIGSVLDVGPVLITPGAAGPRLRTDVLLAVADLRVGDRAAADRVSDAAARLIVAVVEQLRERHRVLAELAAVGVPRSTLVSDP